MILETIPAMRGNLFFIAVGGFCSGIAIGTMYNLSLILMVPFVIVCLFLIGAWIFERNILYLALTIYIVCLALGGVRTFFSQVKISDPFLPLLGSKVVLDGIVTAPPDIRQQSERITIEVAVASTTTKVIATVSKSTKVLIGEHVSVSGKLQSPEPFATDGGRTFAYDKFLAKDGVFALIPYATLTDVLPPSSKYWAWNLLVRFNKYVQTLMQRAIPAPYAALAVGITLGGKEGLSEELTKMFITAGLVQIVVLSGFNISIIVNSLLTVTRQFSRITGIIIAAVGVCAFIAATGLGASAIRAGLMALVALLGSALRRNYDVARALCLTLVVMLVINPLTLLYDPGFQFSFIATLGLIVGSPVVASWLGWIKHDVLRDLCATTFAAEAAVLPILLYQTGNLSLVSIPANILMSPIVPIAMALSGAATIGSLLMPAFAPFIGYPAYASLWWIMEIAMTAANLPFAAVIIPEFPFWVMVTLYGGIGFICWHSSKRLH